VEELEKILAVAIESESTPLVDYLSPRRSDARWRKEVIYYLIKSAEASLDAKTPFRLLAISILCEGGGLDSDFTEEIVASLDRKLNSLAGVLNGLDAGSDGARGTAERARESTHMCLDCLSKLNSSRAIALLTEIARDNRTNEFGAVAEHHLIAAGYGSEET
jgi:hypothetical protein